MKKIVGYLSDIVDFHLRDAYGWYRLLMLSVLHDELIEPTVDPNPEKDSPTTPQIIGETFIKPLQTVTYKSNVIIPGYKWSVRLASDNKEVKDVLTWNSNKTTITVTWTAMVSGEFILQYGNLEKTVVVESLF